MRIINFNDGFTSATAPTIEQAASSVSVTPAGDLSSTNVQAALVELQGDIDTLETHVIDTANPHSVTKTQVGLSNVLNVEQVPASEKGQPDGVADLDSGGRVPLAQLPDSVVGSLYYMGAWNAMANSPALADGIGWRGNYYVVNVAGGTSLNGNTDWEIGDWAVYNGAVWEKIDNTESVVSVAGRDGVITLTSTDVGLANVDNTSDATKNAATATLLGKTLVTPVIDDYIDVNEESAPSTPSAGKVRVYAKTDGKVYKKSSAGVESELGAGAGGSGEKTYIGNASGANDAAAAVPVGWANVGDLDIVVTKTAADLPREYTTASGLKITADSNTQSVADYVYYDFTLDDVDLSKVIKIEWSQKVTGTYTDGQLAVGITTQADRTTFLHTPKVTAIPASDGTFVTEFDASTTATLSLVIRATGDMTTNGGVVISDVIVGPGKVRTGAAVTGSQTYPLTVGGSTTTPTLGTNTQEASWSRDGEYMLLRYDLSQTAGGSAGSGIYLFPLPAGHTIAVPSGVTVSGSTGLGVVGSGEVYDGSKPYPGTVNIYDTTRLYLTVGHDTAATAPFASSTISFINTIMRVSYTARVRIAEWIGSGTLNTLQQDNLQGWTPYTPTFTGWGTVTGNATKWKRIGNDMYLNLTFTAGTLTATNQLISLPTGYTVKTSELSSVATPIGVLGSSSNTSALYALIKSTDSGNVGISVSTPAFQTLTSGTFSATTIIGMIGPIPITQWDGNQSSLVGYSAATATTMGLVTRETSGNFTATYTGFTAGYTDTWTYSRVGKTVSIHMNYSGVLTKNGSSGVALITGLPAALTPSSDMWGGLVSIYFNSATVSAAQTKIKSNGTVEIYRSGAGDVYTAGSTVAFYGCVLTYVLP